MEAKAYLHLRMTALLMPMITIFVSPRCKLDFKKRILQMTQVIKYFALGTPINRLPIMAKQVLDLYELYNLVTARGGLVEVINKKQWQEIIKGLNLPSSITSAAFTLRTQ